jgi:hypothetical protein
VSLLLDAQLAASVWAVFGGLCLCPCMAPHLGVPVSDLVQAMVARAAQVQLPLLYWPGYTCPTRKTPCISVVTGALLVLAGQCLARDMPV